MCSAHATVLAKHDNIMHFDLNCRETSPTIAKHNRERGKTSVLKQKQLKVASAIYKM